MLVLSRRRGERVIIGKDIAVVVLQIGGNCVKLGLDGPPETPIHREELYLKIAESDGRLECLHGSSRPTGERRGS